MSSKRKTTTRRAPMGVAANLKPRNVRGVTDTVATPVAIRARGVEIEDAFREYMHVRCGFKLGKFVEAIERISIRLEDVNGPRNAPASRLAIKVVLSRHESVVVQVVDASHRAAFDRAIEAVERAVKRSLVKERSKARRAGSSQKRKA